MISKDMLEELFVYNDGMLIRKKTTSSRAVAGSSVGSVDSYGYLQTSIDKKAYKVHRLVWILCKGDLPDGDIDHINHDRTDNRIENLRVVSRAENSRNRSGVKGIYFHRKSSMWIASVCVNGNKMYIGSFKNESDARSAYLKKMRQLDFHPNHASLRRDKAKEE